MVFEQVAMFLLFGAAGFVLGKTKTVNTEHSKILSVLTVYLLFPCNILKTYITNFNAGYISQKYGFILVSAGVIAVLIIFSRSVAGFFSKHPYKKRVYEYSILFSNSGYMGYPLMEALFGEKMLLDMMVFSIPVTTCIYTLGFCSLTKRKLNGKNLLNPATFAIVTGMILGLLQVKFPGFVMKAFSSASGCLGPVTMLLAGITVSQFEIKRMVLDYKVYLASGLRLLVIPLAVATTLSLIGLEKYALVAGFLYAMPCGLNAVVFPKLVNEDCSVGAAIAFVSTVLSCLTIPIVVGLIG